MQVYTLLTIGDGLVAQIPSLSTAAAIMVTRVNSESDMREQVVDQMFASPKALTVAALILTIIGIILACHTCLLSLAVVCVFGAVLIQRKILKQEQAR